MLCKFQNAFSLKFEKKRIAMLTLLVNSLSCNNHTAKNTSATNNSGIRDEDKQELGKTEQQSGGSNGPSKSKASSSAAWVQELLGDQAFAITDDVSALAAIEVRTKLGGTRLCMGSKVSTKYVLSAAHCFADLSDDEQCQTSIAIEWQKMTDANMFEPSSKYTTCKKVFKYQKTNENGAQDFDVALLELSSIGAHPTTSFKLKDIETALPKWVEHTGVDVQDNPSKLISSQVFRFSKSSQNKPIVDSYHERIGYPTSNGFASYYKNLPGMSGSPVFFKSSIGENVPFQPFIVGIHSKGLIGPLSECVRVKFISKWLEKFGIGNLTNENAN